MPNSGLEAGQWVKGLNNTEIIFMITPQYMQQVYNIPRHVVTVSPARGYPTKY